MAYGFNEDKSKVEVYSKDNLKYIDVNFDAPSSQFKHFEDFGSSALKAYSFRKNFSIPSNAKIISSDVINVLNVPSDNNYIFSHIITRGDGENSGYIFYKVVCPSDSYPTSYSSKMTFTVRIYYLEG